MHAAATSAVHFQGTHCLEMMQDAVKDADVLVFCTPHQFTRDICRQLRGKVNPTAVAISLTKVGPASGASDLHARTFLLKHRVPVRVCRPPL